MDGEIYKKYFSIETDYSPQTSLILIYLQHDGSKPFSFQTLPIGFNTFYIYIYIHDGSKPFSFQTLPIGFNTFHK